MFAKSFFIQLFSLFHLCTAVHGTIRFANYFQDHMVLQRAPQKAIVWGFQSASDTPVYLTMNNKIYRANTTSTSSNPIGDSIWAVTLDAQYDQGPFQLKISSDLPNGTLQIITLNDVLFGDVWLCSGQSNMQFSVYRMFNSTIEISNAYKYPKVRLFTAATAQADLPQDELPGISMNWSIASNVSVSNGATSAVCWLYGRMINDALGGRPIGLIHSSWGGTNIEYWSPPEVLKDCGISQIESNTLQNTHDQQNSNVDIILNNTVLYNAMIYPFTKMVIKGIIWYQGENNAGYNRDKYNCTFPKMINAWRLAWLSHTQNITDPLFPFGFVQLATNDPSGTRVGGFPWIRWHQTFDVGSVPNTVVPNVFMAAALDLRDDEGGLHPRTKLDVGYRLSRSGLAVAYGFTNITYLGPIVDKIDIASNSSKVDITYTSEASPSIELRNPFGFEVCCDDKNLCYTDDTIWVAAFASKDAQSLLTINLAIPSSCTSKPINGLRYLWKETPCLYKQAAVYNSIDSDIPAPPYIHYF